MGRKVAGYVALVAATLVLGLGGHAIESGAALADQQNPMGTGTTLVADQQNPMGTGTTVLADQQNPMVVAAG